MLARQFLEHRPVNAMIDPRCARVAGLAVRIHGPDLLPWRGFECTDPPALDLRLQPGSNHDIDVQDTYFGGEPGSAFGWRGARAAGGLLIEAWTPRNAPSAWAWLDAASGSATIGGDAGGIGTPERSLFAEHLPEMIVALAIAERGGLYMHGALVAKDDAAMLLIGTSGVGKTTQAATLAKAGWTRIAEDRAGVWLHGDGAFAQAAPWHGGGVQTSPLRLERILRIEQASIDEPETITRIPAALAVARVAAASLLFALDAQHASHALQLADAIAGRTLVQRARLHQHSALHRSLRDGSTSE